MIINNKSVIGFYLYSDSAEYEKGDFVVYKDCIYICTATNPSTSENTVVNSKPNEDRENFKIYPGEMISTADEFFKYSREATEALTGETEPEDKFISMHALYDVLQKLYFGVSTDGIITAEIKHNPDDENDYLVNGLGDLNKVDLLPADAVLQSPNLNNGVLKISRDYFDFLPIYDDSDLDNYYSGEAEDNSMILLRQYTYDFTPEDSNKVIRRRTQELIDPVYGTSYVRYSDAEGDGSGKEFSAASGWTCISIGEKFQNRLKIINNRLETLTDFYIKNKDLSESGSGFKTVYPISSEIEARGTDYYPLSGVLMVDFTASKSTTGDYKFKEGVFTVIISHKIEGLNIYKNYTVTFSSREFRVLNNNPKIYSVADNIVLSVRQIAEGEKWDNRPAFTSPCLSFSVITTKNTISELVITNIYFKEDYE